MIKPSNVIPALKDLLIEAFIDYSAGLTNTGKPFFVDPDNDYDVIEVFLVHSVNYIVNQALTGVSVGQGAGPQGGATLTRFVNSVSLGTAAIAAGVKTSLTLSSTVILQKGHPLVITCPASASQTGEGILGVRLRPKDKPVGNSTKRPSSDAQSAT